MTKQQLIAKNYNEIYAHEMAHKMAGGEYAGDINIRRNAQGIPVSGFVPIRMPVLDKTNPQKTINHADTVIRAALAPDTPSGQDYKVANSAQQIKMRAQAIKAENVGRRLDTRG